ncbi:CaiB/BaiF CoA-transferase family protein [Roseomonas sp. AR75]|uniref:CaiB/BaiF CoA transferase family protein n=1 Tax=Roseomonas sp. AR75 TaxID=2562311 RepID=UPI0010C0B7FE|nr:CaiB/BaiF CoA-transferase family protein [Roseomonas sp. AR75]
MKPLQGITVLDLSRVLAAPYATMLLAEMGAEVIKVEQPKTGDEIRFYEPVVQGESAYYFTANRSKKSITANMRNPKAQQMLRDLAAGVDVVVENFTVGTLKRYGLDYDSLAKANPRLVYLSVTGFGQDGPYAKRRGYDTVFQAMTGMVSLTGEQGGEPCKAGLPVADLSSGLWGAIAVLSALLGRNSSGQGTHIDFSMFDGQVSLLTIAAARWFALGEVPTRMGTEHPGRVPSAAFATADGGHVQITCNDPHWAPLCKLLGVEDWGADPRVATNAARLENRAEVMQKLGEAIRGWKRDDFVEACVAAGVPGGPVLNVREVVEDRHVQSRGMVETFAHPTLGEFPALPVPFRFSGYDRLNVDRPPMLGEHTDQVLRERLGLDEAAIATLRQEGAI